MFLSLFHPHFSWKDVLGIVIFMMEFYYLCKIKPWLLGDPENFIPANPLVTPIHIQPECYMGSVVALALSVAILYVLPFSARNDRNKHKVHFTKIGQILSFYFPTFWSHRLFYFINWAILGLIFVLFNQFTQYKRRLKLGSLE